MTRTATLRKRAMPPIDLRRLADIPTIGARDIVAMRGSVLHELLDRLDDLADATLIERRKAKATEADFIPGDVVRRIVVDRANPVKVFRDWRGMTQHELARKAGLSQSYLAEIERGKVFAVRTAKALALALGVGIEDVVGPGR